MHLCKYFHREKWQSTDAAAERRLPGRSDARNPDGDRSGSGRFHHEQHCTWKTCIPRMKSLSPPRNRNVIGVGEIAGHDCRLPVGRSPAKLNELFEAYVDDYVNRRRSATAARDIAGSLLLSDGTLPPFLAFLWRGSSVWSRLFCPLTSPKGAGARPAAAGGAVMESLVADFRFGARTLWKSRVSPSLPSSRWLWASAPPPRFSA